MFNKKREEIIKKSLRSEYIKDNLIDTVKDLIANENDPELVQMYIRSMKISIKELDSLEKELKKMKKDA